MAEQKTKIEETAELTVESKLRALFQLQQVDTETDTISVRHFAPGSGPVVKL